MRMAETRRRQLSGLGKMAATRVRRRICLLRASQRLEVRRRLRMGSGKAKTVKASGRLFSIQVASWGALREYFSMAAASLVWAVARSSALKMERRSVCNGSKELAATIAGVGTIINTAMSFALIPAVTHFSAKVGKRETLLLAQGLLILGALLSWIVFTPASPWLMLSTLPFNCIALTCILILNGSIMADICDYDELQTGLRREGMYGAVSAFIGKVAFSSIGILSGYMLVWSGYVEADVQTPAAILNMRIFFAFIPAGFGIVGLVLTLFFPLTRKKVMAVRAAIDARRVAQSAMADT